MGYPTMGPWGNNNGNLHSETWLLHGVLCLFFRGVLEIPWDHHESVSAMAVCNALKKQFFLGIDGGVSNEEECTM